MIIPVWTIVLLVLVMSFPVYRNIVGGKDIKKYNDYIPVLSEITGYLVGVLIVSVACAFVYIFGTVIYLTVTDIFSTNLISVLNHEVFYIK